MLAVGQGYEDFQLHFAERKLSYFQQEIGEAYRLQVRWIDEHLTFQQHRYRSRYPMEKIVLANHQLLEREEVLIFLVQERRKYPKFQRRITSKLLLFAPTM